MELCGTDSARVGSEYIGMADSLYLSSMLDTTPKVRDGLAGMSDQLEEDMAVFR